MLATADSVATTTGKKQAMKMRKIAGRSPIPNQRIANGIQARGDKLRKKLSVGRNAKRERTWLPSHKPTGIPRRTASMNPVVTRKSEATRSAGKRPVRISSPRPFATAKGDGKTEGGKACKSHSADQIAIATMGTVKGRRTARKGDWFSVMVSKLDLLPFTCPESFPGWPRYAPD